MTKSDANRIYKEVTERVLDELGKGNVFWRKPWKNVSVDGTYGPRSIDGRPYRGWNVFWLQLVGEVSGYGDPRWGTFKAMKRAAVKQARAEGREIVEETTKTKRGYDKATYFEIVNGEKVLFTGGVKAGEKGTTVILWKRVPPSKAKLATMTPDEREKAKPYMILGEYTVFNADQCEGIAPFVADNLTENERVEAAEAIADGYVDGEGGPLVDYAFRDRAFYRRSDDTVRMPVLEQFDGNDSFYSTLFHELAHSTGHESRLNRPAHQEKGDEIYSREELVAEFTAAMLTGVAGIQNTPQLKQSAAYLRSWITAEVAKDPKLIVNAAAAAQKAADRILGIKFETSERSGEEAAAPLPVAA